MDMEGTIERLRHHLKVLTEDIGERSIGAPEGLTRTQEYIASFYEGLGLAVTLEPYLYEGLRVANVISEVGPPRAPAGRYLLGAHYDSLCGTVGADDNASAIAVQLETARHLSRMLEQDTCHASVKLVSFALEEPPAFLTPSRGSRVHALAAKKAGEKIDGMICLEMVGYSCDRPGCQRYPFPLMHMGYPREGNFIGIVGDLGSSAFTRSVHRAFQRNPALPSVRLTVPFRGWLVPSVRRSDQASFWDLGFKAVMITDTADFRNPHYHTRSDTLDKLDFRFMAEVVKGLTLFFGAH